MQQQPLKLAMLLFSPTKCCENAKLYVHLATTKPTPTFSKSRAQALEWQARNACQRFEACFKFQPFTRVRAISRDSFAGYSCLSRVRNPPLPTPVRTRWDLPVKEQSEPRCLHILLCSVGARQFQKTMRVRALKGRPIADTE